MSGTYERELVNTFRECGIAAMKAPASGSATRDSLPDILALQPTELNHPLSRVWAIEHKTISATTAYADADEIEALESFAAMAGATPYLAARFKRGGRGNPKLHYLVRPENCRLTDSGNFGIPESDAWARASIVVDASALSVDLSPQPPQEA